MKYQLSKEDDQIDCIEINENAFFDESKIDSPFAVTQTVFQDIIKAAIRNGYICYDAIFSENIHCKWHNSSVSDIFEEIQVMHDSGVELRKVYFRPSRIKKDDPEHEFFVQNTGLVGICAPNIERYEIKELIRSAAG